MGSIDGGGGGRPFARNGGRIGGAKATLGRSRAHHMTRRFGAGRANTILRLHIERVCHENPSTGEWKLIQLSRQDCADDTDRRFTAGFQKRSGLGTP